MVFRLASKQIVVRWLSGMLLTFTFVFSSHVEVWAVTSLTVTMDNNSQFTVASTPLGGLGGCGISTGGHSYVSQNVQANVTASYTLQGTAHTGNMDDPFLAIYQPSFDPGNPTNNLVACDDDSAPGGDGLYPLITHSFTNGETFVLVTTSYDASTSLSGTVSIGSSQDLSLVFPEINVQGNGQSISDGDTTPSTSDDTDFGTTSTSGGTVVKTFTITNSGVAPLELAGSPRVALSTGTHFSVTSLPATSVAGGGGTTTFSITFDPTADGTFSDTVSIVNNDADENPYNFNLSGTGSSGPEMGLSQGVTPIADGGSHAFGNNVVGSNTDLVFTITNSSSSNNLTLTTPITIGGTNADQFSLQAQPTSPVASGGGTTTFTVRFSPTSSGAKSATVAIANNDNDENPYNLTLTGTGTEPEMELSRGVTPIADGGNQHFGTKVLGTNTDVVFIITNSGTSNLNVTTPLTIGGTNADQFTLQAQPTSPVASGGGTTTFTVRFTPTSVGAKSASIAIANDDSDENPYDLTLTGTGTEPEIALSQGGTAIADGGSHDLGSHLLNSNTDTIFTIANSGTSTLNVTTPLSLGGTNSDQFSIQVQPSATVASGGGTTTFTLRFTPTSVGAKSATIAIANDDNDENPYNLTITATGTAPEIALSQGATPIADGGSHGFNSQAVGSNTNVTFTITNSGTSNLNLTTPLTLGGTNADQFSIQAQPLSSVASGGGTTTFTVQFSPTSVGGKSATISIGSDDTDENPYNLTLTGTAVTPEISLSQGAIPIVDGGSHDFSTNIIGTSTGVIFTITNSGTSNLNVTTPVTIGGTNADQFSVQAQPTSPIAPGGGTAIFTVSFSPTAVGTQSASISIANNDIDENPFTIALTGIGSGTAPILTTNEITVIRGNSAVTGGDVTDDGGTAITERGICWSTSANPTVSDNCMVETVTGDGIGQYSVEMEELRTSTTYHVRAFATNNIGTTYGPEKTFKTKMFFYIQVISDIFQRSKEP